MQISDDPVTLAYTLAALLLVCIALALPAVLRFIRLRRLDHMLGKLRWPFWLAIDQGGARRATREHQQRK